MPHVGDIRIVLLNFYWCFVELQVSFMDVAGLNFSLQLIIVIYIFFLKDIWYPIFYVCPRYVLWLNLTTFDALLTLKMFLESLPSGDLII